MSQDTQFAQEETTEVDPSFAEMQQYADQVEESEERVGRPPLPRSDYLVGSLITAEFREIFDDKIPAVRVGFTVTEGVTGSVDRTYYDDLFIGWGEATPVEKGSKELRPATDEEIAKRRAMTIATLKRFARVLGLNSFLPPAPTAEGIATWLATVLELKQNGPRVIFSGYTTKQGYTRIVFDSLRSPSDPGKDPKTKEVVAGKTAIDIAREQIAKAGGQTAAAATESGF